MDSTAKVSARNELMVRLRTELVGPSSPNENIAEAPGTRYLAGILWPAGTILEAEDDEDMGVGQEGEETGVAETPVSLVQAMKPSSIGLSFVVAKKTKSLNVIVSFGVYKQETEKSAKKTDFKHKRWQRIPVLEKHQINLIPADGKRRLISLKFNEHVFLEWLVRPLEDRLAISLFLVNRQTPKERASRDPYCLFQAILEIKGEKDNSHPFTIKRMEQSSSVYRPSEVLSDDLLYRHYPEYATGHGTAVEWLNTDSLSKTAGILRTVWMPAYEIPMVLPSKWTGGGSLDMNTLADASSPEKIRSCLQPLIDCYSNWIKLRKDMIGSLDELEQRDTALLHASEWELSRNRMQAGLDKLCDLSDPFPLQAFLFANRAMALQRQRTLFARAARKSGNWSDPPSSTHAAWRPFQIAFILQALMGLVEPDNKERQIADLLWFPTGGGKTEAYLGLAVFAMVLRRLRGEKDGMRGDAGVSVIMRYTLRLLTIQQFQRASTLISACEILRQQDPSLRGGESFRIGLWVGEKSAPNNFDDARDILKPGEKTAHIKKLIASGCTPVQLVSCPWCGAPLTKNKKALPQSWFADPNTRRLIIGCSRPECEFHRSSIKEGIPAVVTDEEIYRLAPDLLIGTVDKFARLPWVPETASIFGRVQGQVPGWGFICEGESSQTAAIRQAMLFGGSHPRRKLESVIQNFDNRPLLPPELIIQDELHLITGPLGTMTGLYETAIDWLASRRVGGITVCPKVVASTATIRRASKQVRALFNRKLSVFPSPGLTAGDSFFAEEQPLGEKPGRLYLGIFAPGRSMKTALVRIYANLLSSLPAMRFAPEDLDPYFTLVGYYNSLRELGGAVRLIEDDIRSRMEVLESREPDSLYEYKVRKLNIRDKVPELTSRISAGDIPAILDQLEKTYYSNSASVEPIDIILATNMISVGVDVDRLGLMVVTGQPKTTAEYIQATSRVGREFPGLVITLYNWARPRDCSHYERYIAYHSAIYRYVESTSVTPFSSRARDRALPAAIITMCRLGITGMAGAASAVRFRPDLPGIDIIRNHLRQRGEDVDGPVRGREAGEQMEACLSRWENETYKGVLYYAGGRHGTPRLMYPLGSRPTGIFATPNSMRDVEPSLGIYLKNER